MSNVASKILIFVAGAGIGSFLTWHFTKTKYEKIADQEIATMKEYYRNKKKELEDKQVKTKEEVVVETRPTVDPDIIEHIRIVRSTGYSAGLPVENEKEGEPNSDKRSVPYVIEPEQFDMIGYETICLTYYADDVLADDMDHIYFNAEKDVGLHFAYHFGEYEEDTVFIRNDQLRIDFEICRDTRNYYDVAAPGDYLE